MRILLIVLLVITAFSENISAQHDFGGLEKRTYDYYLKGDYKNLKLTADTMFSEGIDYYYLRMRLGILSFNKQLYYSAAKHFRKALEFNSIDTVSREYIYYSYLFSGRRADAYMYLSSLPAGEKNITLLCEGRKPFSEYYLGSSLSGSDVTTYITNRLYYEALKTTFGLNAFYESSFLHRFRLTFAYTNFRKTGIVYSSSFTSGKNLNFSQNQFYAKIAGTIFTGWEISGFGHIAFSNDVLTTGNKLIDRLGGIGISRTGWKIRSGLNMSLGKFSNTNQVRGEGYLTILPQGNLNLYFTSGAMLQNDNKWGTTYQVSGEIGFKISKSLWLESGIVKGNSFLSAGEQGFTINNSYLIPATVIFSNIIILPGKHFSINFTPYYSQNQVYSWDLNSYTRTNKLTLDSFGGSVKLIYKTR